MADEATVAAENAAHDAEAAHRDTPPPSVGGGSPGGGGAEPVPRAMGGGAETPAAAVLPTVPPAAVPPKARSDGKPGWLPDKFKSEEDLATSYRELERKQFTRREEMKKEVETEYESKRREGVPPSPDKYEFQPFKLRDGREVGLNAADPLVPWFQTIAHDLGLSQKKAQELVAQFVQQDMLRGPNWSVEEQKLGPAADKRLNRIDGWVRGHVEQKHYDTFAKFPASAANVEFFEQLMELSGEPRFTPDESAVGFTESISRDALQTMQKDPKYWKEKDPQFVARVRAGFRKLSQQNGPQR